jgi:Ca-activated chloride channel family protein
MEDILDGKIQPTVWSPGDQTWVDQANQGWQDRTGQRLISDPCAPLIQDPIGFAMWRPMAEAMGWPDQPIGWETFAALAADPQGWAVYGHPEWGEFKFGHTLPDESNSGLLIMAALAHERLGMTGELTPEMIKSEPVVDAMQEVEEYTVAYGTQSDRLIAVMVQSGSSDLHAVTTNEAEVLKSNAKYRKWLQDPLVFIFPDQGSFWVQHPFCILDAEWVTEEQHEAAQIYADYLLSPEQQARAVEKGLRPADKILTLQSPISLDNGTDPRITPATHPSLPILSPAVAEAIKEVFQLVKRTDLPIHP